MPQNPDKVCAAYFKEIPAYRRIFEQLRLKFLSYGQARGTILISDATMSECEAASSIIGRYFTPHTIKFSLAEFEKALQKTQFEGVSLSALLEAYFGAPMISNKLSRENEQQKKDAFLDQFIRFFERTPACDYLTCVKEKRKFGYSTIMTNYCNIDTKTMLKFVCIALNNLSNNPHHLWEKLAVFSAKITHDPHYFDPDTTPGKLLLHALAYLSDCACPNGAEEKLALYAAYCIEPDNISSFTAAMGLILCSENSKNGEISEHLAFKTFRENGEDYLLNMSNLSRISCADSPKKLVYVVENQMVFSALCPTAARCGASLVCSSGQMKLASVKLLDLLCESGCTILYAGDFDPEGLSIADRLILRHPANVSLWRMSADDYNSIQKGAPISEHSLHLLASLHAESLREVADILLKTKRAAFQELLLAAMEHDIKTTCDS